jgi:hypothetical protein
LSNAYKKKKDEGLPSGFRVPIFFYLEKSGEGKEEKVKEQTRNT